MNCSRRFVAMPKPPHNEHYLELAIVRRAKNDNGKAMTDRMTMANAIVGQFLGNGTGVKGGSSLRFRYGSAQSRYTMDFDTTRKIGLDEFLKGFKRRLSEGWYGFSGECDICLRQTRTASRSSMSCNRCAFVCNTKASPGVRSHLK